MAAAADIADIASVSITMSVAGPAASARWAAK